MSDYVVSARKYRPDSFESLIGQDNIARTLKNSIRRGQRGEQQEGGQKKMAQSDLHTAKFTQISLHL